MKSKKMIQNVALATLIATVGSISLPSLVSAKSVDNSKQINIETTSKNGIKNSPINQSLINKATPFVKTTQNGFYLSQEGYSALDSNEIKVVSDCINNTNKELKNVSKMNTLTQIDNKFVLSTNSNKSVKSERRYGNTSGYINVELMWWGTQIYFSHQAVIDANDYLLGAGTAGGLGAFLGSKGIRLASGYLASISLFASPVAWSMSKLDEGNGVYLNCILYVPCTITVP